MTFVEEKLFYNSRFTKNAALEVHVYSSIYYWTVYPVQKFRIVIIIIIIILQLNFEMKFFSSHSLFLKL